MVNIFNNIILLSTICGKIVIQLIRLAAVLQCIENAFNLVNNNEGFDKYVLSTELNEFIKDKLKDMTHEVVISKDTLLRAQKLLDISNKTKLIFAGYK